jgi:trehalose synthase
MRITETSDVWWKTAVIYCLDVETYLDWDNDGRGDFTGLAQRLDYLSSLGVTCLWLMPFYPSPDRDDGYDIVDFYGVDPRLGSSGDLVEVIRTARDRGMRVIADLVVNHTSDKHPWFQAARNDPDSKYRDFYVWSDQPPPKKDQAAVTFPDQETSVWTFDEKAGQYYLHRFYKHQPDLNVANPLVRDEIAKIMGFWVQLGLSGFRVDAVPFFLETLGVPDGDEALPDPHEYLRDLRAMLNRRVGDAILLGEVNLQHPDQLQFFGGPDGDELHMQFDFIGMQRLYLSLARGDFAPLVEALESRPQPQPESQWASFVRNHDELTLDKLSEQERQEVFAAFGPEPEMQIYGRGLIRRLPPMLDGDLRRIKMVYSLLFSLPGTPVLFYGEEIGMGENLAAGDRLAVRTPMQWSSETNGGFSNAPAKKLPGQPPEGAYAPKFVNVTDQQRDPDSLLNFIRILATTYRSCPELGWGAFEVLEQPHAAVLAHRTTWDDGSVVALHNAGAEPVTVPLTLDGLQPGTVLADLLADGSTEPDEQGRVELDLGAYGYRWLRVTPPGSRRLR